jgi:hypothetical protein
MINDLTDVVGEVNSYIIGKLEVFISADLIGTFVDKMAILTRERLIRTYFK